MRPFISILGLILFGSALCLSQEKPPASSEPIIQDNSFLVEEAYNQEDGVIQHINMFQRLNTGDWAYSETDEWPLRTLKHQLSMTLQAVNSGNYNPSSPGFGDVILNYRYQLVGNGDSRVAVAPRLSLLIPAGNSDLGHGSGGLGFQTNLPISIAHNKHLSTHWNAGATFSPWAKGGGFEASTSAVNLGQSFIWMANPRFNVMLETVWSANESVVANRKTDWSQTLYISPGIRWAYNFKSGLQIVPGIAMPNGVGPSSGDRGVIVYLSFEHPFAFAHSRK